MRLLILPALFGASALSGCVSQVALLPDWQAEKAIVPFEIVDQRPDLERKSGSLSLLITSCDYAIRRMGDERTVPNRVDLLKRDLGQALSAPLAGKRIELKQYTVYLNKSAAMRDQVYGDKKGLIPAAMESMGSKCSKEETTAGWFAASEVTNPYSPFVVDIEVSIDGESYASHFVYSPPQEISSGTGEPASAQAIFEALRLANERLIKEIARRKSPP